MAHTRSTCPVQCTPVTWFLVLSLCLIPPTGSPSWAVEALQPTAAERLARSDGQTVYVAVYSHIYIGDRPTPFLLTATVSVRNTDPRQSIMVEAADYHDTGGSKIRPLLENPTRLPPLAAMRFVIPESDTAGGSGASVPVRWQAARPVNPPLIESVMVGTRSQQGISFTSRGQILDLGPAVDSEPAPKAHPPSP